VLPFNKISSAFADDLLSSELKAFPGMLNAKLPMELSSEKAEPFNGPCVLYCADEVWKKKTKQMSAGTILKCEENGFIGIQISV
jgi:hypothetical protein